MDTVLGCNPLLCRADLQQAVRDLVEPVRRRLSPGCARARLGVTGAHFPDEVAELEGFSRPWWGLVPLAAGGADVDWTPYLRGVANGTDPEHPEYWGPAGDGDQRLVEMAAIGFALAMVPEQVWEPLDERARHNLARWLSQVNQVAVPGNNWLFFQVIVNEGLARVGTAGYDQTAQRAALDKLESWYLGDGWYSDGPGGPRDYYVGFGMHWYGLVYSRLAADRDPARAERFRQRAADFAPGFARWFADDGAALPFGRSLTYGFAQGAFWGALAFAGVEALPWGQVKGLALRHIRWWARRPITDHAGLLTIGYGYPNLNMAEPYNSPSSPYWAMKFFLPLAVAAEHPFWTATEEPHPGHPTTAQPHAGMVLFGDRADGHVVALAGGQQNPLTRHGAEKYAKFAYSTAFAFSVPAGTTLLDHAAADSALALSDDEVHWRVRRTCDEWSARGDTLWSRWRPMPGVEIETWLLPRPPWHVRVHRMKTERPLWAAEGGWALDRTGEGEHRTGPGHASASYPAGHSGLRDLRTGSRTGSRTGEVVRLAPNTNLTHPRTVLPTLRSRHEPGEHWLACAVLGTTSDRTWADAWHRPPSYDAAQMISRASRSGSAGNGAVGSA